MVVYTVNKIVYHFMIYKMESIASCEENIHRYYGNKGTVEKMHMLLVWKNVSNTSPLSTIKKVTILHYSQSAIKCVYDNVTAKCLAKAAEKLLVYVSLCMCRCNSNVPATQVH